MDQSAIVKSDQYFAELQRVAGSIPFSIVDAVATQLLDACEKGQTAYLFGNGGSAALASHFACDLGKGIGHYSPGPRFKAVSLVDNAALMTAWANDQSYEDVFAEPLTALARPGDVAIAISASGNSRNVLCGLEAARVGGARTIGFGGFNGGKMKAFCDTCIVVPSNNMQIIEDMHLSVAHTIFTIMVNFRKRIYRNLTAAAAACD